MKKKLLLLVSFVTTFFVNAQNVGIGTANPLARLHVADSSVVFSAGGPASILTYGNPPIRGEGRRMMWYAEKGAFRAGYVDAKKWDKDSTGYYSIGLGYNSKASGYISFATGANNIASGSSSTAMGNNSTASGQSSFAMGENTISSGWSSTAMGSFTTASGFASTAMGYNSIQKLSVMFLQQ